MGEHPDHMLVAESNKDSPVPAAATSSQSTTGCLLILPRFVLAMGNLKPKEVHYIPRQSHD